VSELAPGKLSLRDAVLLRRSVRAFTGELIPRATIEAIVEPALRSPSGGNLQPWHIHVVTGEALAALKRRMSAHQETGHREVPDHDIYPADLWEPYRSRRFENGEDLYRTIGIERENRAGRLLQLARNFQFFGAPVGLFFTIDRRMGGAQWMDVGMVMHSVMLLALEHGLATCPQAAWALWPDTLTDMLGLGPHITVAVGIALGNEDRDQAINSLKTARQSLAEGVTFHDA
jgi:nitroreductase